MSSIRRSAAAFRVLQTDAVTHRASRCRAYTSTTRRSRGRSEYATCCPMRPNSCCAAACRSSTCGVRFVGPYATRRSPSVTLDPDHRWFYVPEMRADELLLLKCYDTKTDGRARFAPHTAFTDPTTPVDAPPRESIELRTLVFHVGG